LRANTDNRLLSFVNQYLVLFIFFVFVAYNIEVPPLDLHTWRQTQTLSTARNFFFDQWNIFLPQIDSNGDKPFVLLEFPIYQYAMALLWRVFGYSYEVGRLWSIFLVVAASFFVNRSAEMILGRPLRAFFHALLIVPMVIFWSRTFMIDNIVLFFSAGVIYSLLLVDARASLKFLTLFFLHTAGLLLVKPNLALIPALYSLYFLVSRPFLRRHAVAVISSGILALGVGVMWFLYAKTVNAQNPHGYTQVGMDWIWGTLVQIRDPWSLQVLLFRVLVNGGGAFFLILAIIGFFRPGLRVLSLLGFVSPWLYLASAPNLNLVHSYYQLPMALPFALTAIVVIEDLIKGSSFFVATTLGWVGRSLAFAGAISILHLGNWYEFAFGYGPRPYDLNGKSIAASNQIRALFQEKGLLDSNRLVKNVLICDLRTESYDPHSVLYLSQARGFHLNREQCIEYLNRGEVESDYEFKFVISDPLVVDDTSQRLVGRILGGKGDSVTVVAKY
jgi:4-amino-4-deoxy-L-arabinose transferase-like glycosyltransferase